MSELNQDAQHPATPIRLQQAQQEGDAPKSSELVVAIQLLCGVVAVYFLLQGLTVSFADFTKNQWSLAGIDSKSMTLKVNRHLTAGLWDLGKFMLPFLAIIFAGAILSHLLQAGTSFGFKRPLLQWRHLNPANGIDRVWSIKNLSRGLMGVPKIVIVVLVALTITWNQRYELANLQHVSVETAVSKMTYSLFLVLFAATTTLLLISLIDYLIERFSFSRRHQMTDQQLRDENRMQGADPQVANRRRQLYQDL